MNIYSDIGILDLRRIQPPFAIPYEVAASGVGRPAETFEAIPRGDEVQGTAIGRASDQ